MVTRFLLICRTLALRLPIQVAKLLLQGMEKNTRPASLSAVLVRKFVSATLKVA